MSHQSQAFYVTVLTSGNTRWAEEVLPNLTGMRFWLCQQPTGGFPPPGSSPSKRQSWPSWELLKFCTLGQHIPGTKFSIKYEKCGSAHSNLKNLESVFSLMGSQKLASQHI